MEKKQSKRASLGDTVKVRLSSGEVKKFKIVTTLETDPINGKISNLSPLGRAIIGASKNEKRIYIVGGKEFEIEILEV